MSTIFYSMAVLFLLYELFILFNPEMINIESKSQYAVQFIYMIWSLIGLTGSQWEVFAILLLLGLITGIFRYITNNNKKYRYYFTRIDALAASLLLTKVILYHFCINP